MCRTAIVGACAAAVVAMAAAPSACAQAKAEAPSAAAAGPRPRPIQPPTDEEIAAAVKRGTDFLLSHQNPDGSWGSPRRTKQLNIYAPVPGAHHAFRVAVTSLCVAALIEAGGRGADVRRAVDRAEAYLLANLPKLRRAVPSAIYNNWSHAYGIRALVRMAGRARNDERRRRIRGQIAQQIGFLKRYESLNGGWGYLDFRARTQHTTATATSFMTATVLIAMHEAAQIGVKAPRQLVDRALASIKRQWNPDFTYHYSESFLFYAGRLINRAPGSLGRTQVCNLALRLYGDRRITDALVKTWLNRLYARNGWLSRARKMPVPHESWFQVAGYFYYYGHYYAAQCVELLPPKERPPFQAHLARILLAIQEKDGSWWDYPLYDYQQYWGTPMAMMALGRCRGGETAAPPAKSGQSGGTRMPANAPRRGEPPAPDKPLLVKAWLKKGKPRQYETAILAHLRDFEPRPVRHSRYGGWAGRKHKATGFFHSRKIGDRWWLIDPEGFRFLHVAVNAVRPGRSPAMRRALAGKYGTQRKWSDAALALLYGSAFNGTGSWSDDALNRAAPRPPAYTPNWNFMSSYGRKRGGVRQVAGHKAYPNDCIFAFDPEFEKFADAHARQLAAAKDDPYLLGHFSDNELPFPRDLLDKALKLPAADPTHRAAKAWLAKRKGARAATARITRADREAWRGHVADRYFGICARAIRKHDPNHLYLGSRFYGSEKGSEAVFRAAGKHLDVAAVNVYHVWTPRADMLARWARWSGRPLLITEWYAKGADSGLANTTGAGWTVPTQKDRGRFYQNFTLGLLRSKVCVGWHWFKYMDNDPAYLKTDPSNRDSNKGVVTIRYEPYEPLLAAMKELNRAAYPLTEYFDGRR